VASGVDAWCCRLRVECVWCATDAVLEATSTIRHCPHLEQVRQPASARMEPQEEMTPEETEEADMMKQFGFG
jgi:hypothetical protein